jgi:hypothetical protein
MAGRNNKDSRGEERGLVKEFFIVDEGISADKVTIHRAARKSKKCRENTKRKDRPGTEAI